MKLLKSAGILSKLSYNDPDSLWNGITTEEQNVVLEYLNVKTPEDVETIFINGQPVQDTQAYIWKTKQKIVVSFRGTSSIKDAMTDVNIIQCGVSDICDKWMTDTTSDYAIYIHSGFLSQYLTVREQLIKHISDGTYEEFLITGHSLGGALATLSAVDLFSTMSTPHTKTVVTIGSPRVGNSTFVKEFDSANFVNYRIFNDQDPVPQVPISPFYKHVGNGICVNDDGYITFAKTDLHWLLRPFVMLATLDFFKPIADHDTNQYIERLGNQPIKNQPKSPRHIWLYMGILTCIASYLKTFQQL
jgi:predicted lipase